MPSLKCWSLVFYLWSDVSGPRSPVHSLSVRCTLYAAFSLLFCLICATAHASDFSILPSIAVSEEYTDNVFQTQTDKKTEFITHLTPGLAFIYRAPFWDWDLAYILDYRYYARNSQGGQFSHYLDTKGNLRVIENFLFLDISDSFKKVSLDVNRDTTADST
ncbi:MAG TPA: TIGR03016 family PEP-CTERM system-associated outer membrane protein, partial [Geobacteraceae bacterium]|nr:TIGR03016 family PEP-CTERM system-associated outer membrane protein [Geobacteraceae bacterium]